MLETRNFEIPPRRIDPVEFRAALDLLDTTPEAPILLAAMARDHEAFSYRDFLVGCSVAFKFNGSGKETRHENIGVTFGGNFKKTSGKKDPERDKCAERKALERALALNPKFIHAIFTVSKERGVDSDEIEKHDVLHPCKGCRAYFKELMKQGLISPSTRLVNVKDSGKFWEKNKGPFDIEEYAKTYKYENQVITTVGNLIEEHILEDVEIII